MNRTNEENIRLSPRQKDVLTGISKGQANKQIANGLGISEATVKMHVSALLRLMKVRNRVQILLKAKDLRLV